MIVLCMYVYASLSSVIQLNCINLSMYNNDCMYAYVCASLRGVIQLNCINLSVYNNNNKHIWCKYDV